MAFGDGYYNLLDSPSTSSQEVSVEDENAATPFQRAVLTAADNHNLLNNGASWTDGLLETIENIPKFVAVSLASGVNQVYNIAPTVGNWFGGDFKQNDLATTLQGFDDDLAKYYTEHQQSADAVGFIISSLVPGTAGVKVLRAGQVALETGAKTGILGTNLAKSVGLLGSSQSRNLKAAVDAIRTTGNTFSLLETNTLKALGAGFGQAALEGAAFETAVAATMYNSPMLKDQDVGDIVSNILTGALVYGGIGGVISGAQTVGTIKKARVSAASAEFPWTHITEAVADTSPAQKIAIWLDDLHNMPAVPEGLDTSAKWSALAAKKSETIFTKIRGEFQALSGNDGYVATQLHEGLKNLPKQDAIGNVWQLSSATRLSEVSKFEASASKLEAKIKNLTATPEDLAEYSSKYSFKYLRTSGEGAGEITGEAPKVIGLADTIKKTHEIEISGGKVKLGGEVKYKFSVKDDFNVAKVSHLEAEARQIWAANSPALEAGAVIGENDVALLGKAFFEQTPNISVRLADSSGHIKFRSPDEFLEFIINKKNSLANSMVYSDASKLTKAELAAGTYKRSQEEIAKIVDVRNSYLSGVEQGKVTSDIFAFRTQNELTPDFWKAPSVVKLGYDISALGKLSDDTAVAMTAIKTEQRMHQEAVDRAVAAALPEEISAQLIDFSDDLIRSANPTGAGPKFVSFANGNYGTAASAAEYIGSVTTRAIKNAKEAVTAQLTPSLVRLRTDAKAAIELETIFAKLRGTPEKYVFSEAGDSLVLRSFKKYEDAVKAGMKDVKEPVILDPKAPLSIPIKSDDVRAFLRAHVDANGKRLNNLSTVRSAGSLQEARHADTIYPPPRNPKDFPFFAFVVDDTITGGGHSKMLYAASEKELQSQINAVKTQFPEFKVLTKVDAEDYYKSIGKFEYERTLSENHIDVALARKGISTPFLVRTDPAKITDDFLDWHLRNEASTVREIISAKYQRPFEELLTLGKQFTNVSSSRYGSKSLLKYAENTAANPYLDYVKTSLGINTANEYPFWSGIQKSLDNRISSLFAKIDEVRRDAKSVDDLVVINQHLKEAGYDGAYYNAVTNSLANHTAPKAALADFVQKSNALLATFTLRLDPLNSLNNVIGSNVLRSTELAAVLRAMKSGDAVAAGKLAELVNLKLPGLDKSTLTSGKLLSNAIKNFHDPELREFYRAHGFITSVRDQYLQTLDTLALKGTENALDLSGKLRKAHELVEQGTKLTGNSLAEEFNRFVSADVMRQITDHAVGAGVMSKREALTYINTFVNRVEGNYLAAQRPMMFQGPVGQAIGLFQTYQFNLIQQLLRHVGEGSAKDAAMLLGMQGTIYGLNGLPAFNAINTHIIGTASGNTNHTDAYSVVYGAAGKEAGDWLMYGVASNFLLHPDAKMNLYTRGDINPRHVTVVPTNPADVPIVNAFTKVMGNIFDTAAKIKGGGDVSTVLLQGLEHNGVSRPLAGLAQVLESFNNPYRAVYSTTNAGDVIATNDLVSLASAGRLLGARPLDEAYVRDAVFRNKAYAAKEHDKVERLGEVVKSTLIAGGEPTEEQMTGFLESYVKAGGRQENFNKFMMRQYMNANTSQANRLKDSVSNSYAQSLQKIMGGYDLRDFSKE